MSTRRDWSQLVASLVLLSLCVVALKAFAIANSTTVALALLVVVLGTSTFASWWVAVALSVGAMLALNFFFLPPVGTFTIADPQNWVALVRVPGRRHHRQPAGPRRRRPGRATRSRGATSWPASTTSVATSC